MILDEDTLTNASMESALSLLERKADSLETYRIKGLSLRLVLFGLAEIQALRLSRLGSFVYTLEQELLDPKKIQTLDPRMLLSLYSLASKSLVESSEFIERVTKNMNYEELEVGLLQMRASEVKPDKSGISAEDSDELLNFISRLKAEKEKGTIA